MRTGKCLFTPIHYLDPSLLDLHILVYLVNMDSSYWILGQGHICWTNSMVSVLAWLIRAPCQHYHYLFHVHVLCPPPPPPVPHANIIIIYSMYTYFFPPSPSPAIAWSTLIANVFGLCLALYFASGFVLLWVIQASVHM